MRIPSARLRVGHSHGPGGRAIMARVKAISIWLPHAYHILNNRERKIKYIYRYIQDKSYYLAAASKNSIFYIFYL